MPANEVVGENKDASNVSALSAFLILDFITYYSFRNSRTGVFRRFTEATLEQ